MTDGFHFQATCPRCGGELLTEGHPAKIDAPDVSHHDARCDHCLDVYRVTVSMCLIEAWPIDRCDPESRRAEAAGEAARVLHVASVAG